MTDTSARLGRLAYEVTQWGTHQQIMDEIELGIDPFRMAVATTKVELWFQGYYHRG